MKCFVCEKETTRALIGLGPYCSEECRQKLLNRQKEMYDQLLTEPWYEAPDEFNVSDFDRFTLKMALHTIQHMHPEIKEEVVEKMPFLLDPDQMAMDLKERIIQHLPKEYVRLEEARGHDKIFYGGTYEFLNNVPREEIFKAMEKAKLIGTK